MMKMRWKKWLAGAMGLLLLAVLVPLGAAAQPEQVHISTAQELAGILSQTQPEATQGKEYVLDADITLDTNTLRQGLNPEDIRVFAGTLQGGGHTITVTGPEASAPLFEQLRGSVRGLNLVFTGDVAGTPFALDASYSSPEEPVSLTELSVVVQGNVLFGDHDYSQSYGSLLTPPNNYGNWYIHYGGQPVHLATGFAWYLWGVSVSQVQVQVAGNIGEFSRQEGDAAAAGYGYKGNTHRRDYSVTVGGDIAATSPVQAVAAGFNGPQSIGTNYFIRGAQVVVQGNILYWYCSRCDSYFADEALTQEISREDTILPATGHDFAEAWSWDAENHFHQCKVCGEKQDVAGHAWQWMVDKEPTQTEPGAKHQECSVCGYAKDPVEIPPEGGENPTTEPTTNPTTKPSTEATDPNGPDQTGETAQPWLLAVLMVLSAGCVAVTLRRRIVK